MILETENAFFPSRISSNRFSCLILPKIKRWKNFKFLTKTMDLKLTPLEKSQIFNFFVLSISRIWSNTLIFFLAYLSLKKKKIEKIQIVDQNHGPTLLEKYQIFDFLNFVILESKNTFFLSRISSNTFSWPVLPKIKRWKISNFSLVPWIDFFNFLCFIVLYHF